MADIGDELLRGPDRIAFSARLGRPIRQGNPAALEVDGASRAREAIERGDFGGAYAYVLDVHHVALSVLAFYAEWLPQLTGEVIAGKELARERERSLQAMRIAFAVKSAGAAVAHIARHVSLLRRHHDDQVRAVDRALETLLAHGEAAFARAMSDSLAAVGSYQRMLELTAHLQAHELAAVLAEHLRGHFSGPGRAGGVRIEENAESFRLIMDPCGSGGALRRERAAKLVPATRLVRASALTWSRRDEVPLYCAHCACNELATRQRLGYRAWVTEFDPEPDKPCAWVIYKDRREDR
jgi:hypothetical protein